jgi:hypothetical protein
LFTPFNLDPIINLNTEIGKLEEQKSRMVHICMFCGEMFLYWLEYNNHTQRHMQTHLDKWSNVETMDSKTAVNDIQEGMNGELYKLFEKYNLGSKAMLCLWSNGQLNCAMREPAREYELQDRLKVYQPAASAHPIYIVNKRNGVLPLPIVFARCVKVQEKIF